MPQPTAGEVATAIGLSIPAFFSDATDQLIQGEGEYIATGQPQGLVAQVGQEIARAACRRHGAGVVDLVATKGQRFENACRPYLNTISPNNGLSLIRPFTGGQCDGIIYTIAYAVSNLVGGNGNFTRRAYGPIAGMDFQVSTRNAAGQPTAYSLGIVAKGVWQVGESPPAVGPSFRRTIQTTSVSVGVTGPSVSVTSVTRLSGTDNCGNPGTQAVPPAPQPDPSGRTYVFNPNPKINLPVDIVLNPDGTITFDVGTGPITVDPFPDDGAGEGGAAGGSGRKRGDVGEAAAPVDTGAGGDAEGEAPEGKVIGALQIGIQSFPARARQYEQGIFRGACYVYMGVDDGLDQDFAGAMLIDDQLILPEKDNLTKWRVKSNPGYNLRVTPYYIEALIP